MIYVSDSIKIPDQEITLSFSRSAGPGGQNVNKVSSRVTLTWIPENSAVVPEAVIRRFLQKYQSKMTNDGRILINSNTSRVQKSNILICKEKLAKMLQNVLRPPKTRTPTQPTKASKERRLKAKKKLSEIKVNRKKISY